MAYSKFFAFVAIVLVTLCKGAGASKNEEHNHGHDDLPRALAPSHRKLCDAVECGKGRCVPTIPDIKYPLGYKCQCDPGWTRTQFDFGYDQEVYDAALVFMPCVIPNSCYWTYCGEGRCIKNSTNHYRCDCKPGFYNLVNMSYFPCYSDCTLGSDCSSLGIEVSNAGSDDVDDIADDDDDKKKGGDDYRNQATPFLPRKFHLVAIFMAVVLALWQ